MFSAISAYFFGEDDLQPNFEGLNEIEDEDNEWIFVDRVTQQGETNDLSNDDINKTVKMATRMEESWLVTPPSCFSGESKKKGKDSSDSLENLLIEHPSMSVYGPRSADKGPSPEQPADGSSVVAKQNGTARHVAQGKVFLCQSQKDRGPLKDLGCNYGNSLAYTKSRKGSNRSNHTHQRALHGRHYKKLNRKDGKHVGMVGKRAA